VLRAVVYKRVVATWRGSQRAHTGDWPLNDYDRHSWGRNWDQLHGTNVGRCQHQQAAPL